MRNVLLLLLLFFYTTSALSVIQVVENPYYGQTKFIILFTYQLVWPSVSNIWKMAFGYGKVEH